MAHKPSGLEGDFKDAVKLIAADALLGRAHKVKSLEPLVHRYVAILEDRPDLHRERLIAVVAFPNSDPGALTAQRLDAICRPTMRTDGTIGPQLGLDPRVSGVLVVEAWGG